MLSAYVWVRVVAGTALTVLAIILWLRWRRQGPVAWHWSVLTVVAFATCAWLSVGQELTHPRALDLWSDLQLTALLLALLLAVCALAIAAVSLMRATPWGPRTPDRR
jgi:predicted permease